MQTEPAAQSDGSAQLFRHVKVAPSHVYAPQSVVAGAHWPVALHLKAVSVDPEHVVGAQVVSTG